MPRLRSISLILWFMDIHSIEYNTILCHFAYHDILNNINTIHNNVIHPPLFVISAYYILRCLLSSEKVGNYYIWNPLK